MDIRPGKCLLPQILRERKIEPVDFYTSLGWVKQKYNAYANNRKKMSIGTLKTVADALQIPMDDVYVWVTPRKGVGQEPE
jgi:hypothetical protein